MQPAASRWSRIVWPIFIRTRNRLPSTAILACAASCDLSAGSGYNAVSRDPDFGYAFLEEFQDRCFFGTDICDPRNIDDVRVRLASFLDDGMKNGKLSYNAYEKISRGNAEDLLD